MRKIKEVLRLRYELKLDQRQIARSCSLAVSTVHEYLKRAEAAGVGWPLPAGYDDGDLERALYGNTQRVRQVVRQQPDFAAIDEQLRRHKHVTLQLVWEEYRETNPDAYGYSRFCELYQRWRRKLDIVMRQDHKAGERMFVDWAGATVPIHDRITGAVSQAPLFVATLGASSYTYAEATRDQQMQSWLRAHARAFEYCNGVPALVVPDNTKTGVTRPCRYDPDLNPEYYTFAQHYGFGIVPARPYKPRDKACVSYCTLFGGCNVESWLRGTAASLALYYRTIVQRFIKAAPGIVVAVLFEPSFSCPKIDCSGRHIVTDAHLFGSKQPLGSQPAIAAHQVESLSDMRNLLQVKQFTLPGLPSSSI